MEQEFQRISALVSLSLADLEEELAKQQIGVYKLEMRMTTWVRATYAPAGERPLIWNWQFCNRTGRLLAQAKDPIG